MSWFSKVKKPLEAITSRDKIPEGIWKKCDECKAIIYGQELDNNFQVCPKCGHHHRLSARERIRLLIDEGTFQEKDGELAPNDPLKFRDSKKYKDRIAESKKKTGLNESAISGSGLMCNRPVEIAVLDFDFIGGTLGSVAGEKITRTIERSIRSRHPAIIVSSSGGARMQEGIFSLMQMAKTSSALGELDELKIPFISLLAHPVTGGVSASFAMLGDVIIAEPKALIGFAGPRVIEETIREQLPEGFQRSEFMMDHGFVDMVVPRLELKETMAKLLDHMCGAIACLLPLESKEDSTDSAKSGA
ncbi:MAG: acetyl-CoA carboxylase, carboxyltransferase subunit beta [Nitrospinota bacterium]|nr:acetyl-CoA carboxylase, carboxyltransferase subunit beta [Nitrospinota bacterium]MDH5757695.1 acetyl-CoA carboxylase, carboxyltransferase subunit beta [Nitrospinota bacterium]